MKELNELNDVPAPVGPPNLSRISSVPDGSRPATVGAPRGGRRAHVEMALFVHAGLSPAEAMRAATGAARLLGRRGVGVIAPGRLADLVLVEGDPTKDIRATQNIRLVIKGGSQRHVSSRFGARLAYAREVEYDGREGGPLTCEQRRP